MKNRFIAVMLLSIPFAMTNIALAESETGEEEKPQEVVVSATRLETPASEVSVGSRSIAY